LDFIYPFELANTPKVSKLPGRTRMYPVLFVSFLKLHFCLGLIFLPFWNSQYVYFRVQALNSNHTQSKLEDQGILSKTVSFSLKLHG